MTIPRTAAQPTEISHAYIFTRVCARTRARARVSTGPSEGGGGVADRSVLRCSSDVALV